MTRAHRRLSTACGLLALALTGAPASAIPGSTAATAATAPARPSGTGADVILVLDNSASMRRADPRGLMRAAATDFARSLGSAAQLGVVIFDQRADLAVPLTPVGDGVSTPAVDAALRRLTYGGRRTDIPAGVERALYALRTTGRQGVQRAIVVFTDGVVDLGDASRNVSQARWLREDLAAEARALEIPVFGIAFTDAADFELVQSLARSTGGGYFRVTSADGIADTFAQVHARIAELASRWIAENAAPPPAAGFAVDTATLLAAGGILGVLIALFVRIGRRRPGEAAMPAATFRMVDADGAEQVHALRAPVTRIGRAKDNDVVLTSDTISAHHALIEWHGGSFHLKDLGSTNGTRRNGKLGERPRAARAAQHPPPPPRSPGVRPDRLRLRDHRRGGGRRDQGRRRDDQRRRDADPPGTRQRAQRPPPIPRTRGRPCEALAAACEVPDPRELGSGRRMQRMRAGVVRVVPDRA